MNRQQREDEDNDDGEQRTLNNNRKYLGIIVLVQLLMYSYFQFHQQTSQKANQQHTINISSSLEGGNGVKTNVNAGIHPEDVFQAFSDDPMAKVLARIAAHVYFLPLKNLNVIGEIKTQNEKRFLQFLYPEDPMWMRERIKDRLLSSDGGFDMFDEKQDYAINTKQESFFQYFLSLILGGGDTEEQFSGSHSLGKLKSLRDKYLKETMEDSKKVKFLKELNQAMTDSKTAQDIQNELDQIDTLREESVTISHKHSNKGKVDNIPKNLLVTDVLNLDASENNLDILQDHFSQLVVSVDKNSPKIGKEFMLKLKKRAVEVMMKSLPSANSNTIRFDQNTSHLANGQIIDSIYTLMATSPRFIRSWFKYKLIQKVRTKLINSFNSVIGGENLIGEFEISSRNCDRKCRETLIQSYHVLKTCPRMKHIRFRISNNERFSKKLNKISLSILDADNGEKPYQGISSIPCGKKNCASAVISLLTKEPEGK